MLHCVSHSLRDKTQIATTAICVFHGFLAPSLAIKKVTGVEPRFATSTSVDIKCGKSKERKRSFRDKTQIATIAICVFHGFLAPSSPPTKKGTHMGAYVGGDDGSRTRVQKPLDTTFSGCRKSFDLFASSADCQAIDTSNRFMHDGLNGKRPMHVHH